MSHSSAPRNSAIAAPIRQVRPVRYVVAAVLEPGDDQRRCDQATDDAADEDADEQRSRPDDEADQCGQRPSDFT